MIDEVEGHVNQIVDILNNNYVQFETLKNKLNTTSLLKVYATEKSNFFSFFF